MLKPQTRKIERGDFTDFLNLNKKNLKLGGRFEVMFDELIFFMMGDGFQTYFQIGTFLILSPNFQINIDIAYFQ